MIKENQNRVKKQYQSPCLEVIQLDNHIALGAPSEGPPDHPPGGTWSSSGAPDYIKPLPEYPAVDNPFGGSSPNYK